MRVQYSPTVVLEFTDEQIRDFWNRMDRSGGLDSCWEWQGSRMKNGYGRIIQARNRHYYTHRIAYVLANGPLGDLHALHHCDNRPCCNPAHLFAGTEADNSDDKMAKGRHRNHGGLFGSRNPLAKLTEDDVRAMREMFGRGVSCKELAAIFGVGHTNVFQVVKRHTWKHV